jgi:hypothetical protein
MEGTAEGVKLPRGSGVDGEGGRKCSHISIRNNLVPVQSVATRDVVISTKTHTDARRTTSNEHTYNPNITLGEGIKHAVGATFHVR